ncbi:hypothetical protein [Nocardia sp. NPDC057353]|uniref:hypothetical protein n=1 Tax=Nocardia sp. NPDC057353 TaxID=3346104 RepID=UPI00363EE516
MSQPFRTSHRIAIAGATAIGAQLPRPVPDSTVPDCNSEPHGLTYRQAREMLRAHDAHGPRCRQWLAAAAYLSAGLDDE